MSVSDSNLGTLVEVDSRRRISLGQLGHPSRYLATVDSDGPILLRPAVVITELEARLMTPALADRVAANREDPSRLVKRRQ